jgi:hypothetical protein
MNQMMSKPRFISVDVMKGLAMICMAIIHGSFFFKTGIVAKLFMFIDPFVFPTFLFCFGIGNGLSRRIKNSSVLAKLSLVYLMGGLPSGVVYFLYKQQTMDLSRIHIIASEQFLKAITLQERIAYADFLVPFIFCYALFLGFQYLLKEFNARTLGIAILISIAGYGLGQLLAAIAPNFFLQDLYSQGFRVLQSLPVFMAGVCTGLWLRKNGIPKSSPRSTQFLTALLCLIIIGCYFGYERYSYAAPGAIAWKKSGELSYLCAAIIAPITLMLSLEGFVPLVKANGYFNAMLSILKRIGENTFKCLWLQLLMLPILGYLCSLLFPELVRVPALGLAVLLIFGLTLSTRSAIANYLPLKKYFVPLRKLRS